jgi:zeta-carotene desaturase
MESATRSGRLVAGVVAGDPTLFLAPETPATGLMRWLTRIQPRPCDETV